MRAANTIRKVDTGERIMKNDALIQSILRNTIELNEDRLAIKDREIARLMQQVADLKAKVNI